jgi:carbamate kinase
MIEQCLQNMMKEAGISKKVATILTQVLVDENDPSLSEPTKFVGPFFKAEDVKKLETSRSWVMKEDKGRGFRRVVPSPVPQSIIPKDTIKLLSDNGTIVIAAGGGGIPVYYDRRGWLEGVDAVVDKDRASAVLANEVGAEKMLILTGVDKVAVQYGTAKQKNLDVITVAEAKQYMKAGEFPKGSMGPKIEAALSFLESGGKEVIITSIEQATVAIKGKAGTKIVHGA